MKPPLRIRITPRQLEIWRMIANDFSEKAMADRLGVVKQTVSKLKCDLYRKLGVHTLVGATRAAVAHGVVTITPAAVRYEVGPPLHAPVTYSSMFGRKTGRPLAIR